MPVINLKWKELEKLVGANKDLILKNLPMIGCDIERIDDETISIEFFPNRPDLYSIEGVARALRGFLGIETGLKEYKTKYGGWKIFVDDSVLSVRPRIVGCVVKNLEMSDEVIRSFVDVQEDLHWTIGRNRRKMAIGIHDLGEVYFPLRYTAVNINFSFIPLDFNREMTVAEILREHPKGMEYGFILEGKNLFPMIIDSKNEVISFPPIINAEKTRVTEKTRNLFIDVTGFDEYVDKALKIIACMLNDRGGEIETLEIIYPDRKEITPNLSSSSFRVRKSEIYSLLGLEIPDKEIISALERMRFACRENGNYLEILVPPYRADIMHEWDIIEDIAIGYGYERITPEYPKTSAIGESHPWNELKEIVKEIMIGLGFIEVITFTLTSEKSYSNLRRHAKPWKDYVPLMHPLTADHTIVRTDLLSKLLEVLALNRHCELPIKIFEVGDVVVGIKNRLKLCFCIMNSKVTFAELRSYVQAFMREIGLEWKTEELEDGAFIAGRQGKIIVNGKNVGIFGEIHPEVLEKFGIPNPVVAFEIDLDKIFNCGELL
ncbi:MAG: phenylalanine--tRNA ligase subunit beta [Archaeoglobaceae archaeon]|nr:phenylalanine--tRNA ligase subunit beta [Archaeoglobaceae archaeon]MDW7990320.1 phenylalanine--tRNA ligase subunit beta [Archaeoglobaceae archaeon]